MRGSALAGDAVDMTGSQKDSQGTLQAKIVWAIIGMLLGAFSAMWSTYNDARVKAYLEASIVDVDMSTARAGENGFVRTCTIENVSFASAPLDSIMIVFSVSAIPESSSIAVRPRFTPGTPRPEHFMTGSPTAQTFMVSLRHGTKQVFEIRTSIDEAVVVELPIEISRAEDVEPPLGWRYLRLVPSEAAMIVVATPVLLLLLVGIDRIRRRGK